MARQCKLPLALSWALSCVMVAQGALGLLFHGEYRDVQWIAATWYGNDAVTLLLVAPLLIGTLAALARQFTARRTLLWLGLLGYSVYNYAYYMLGTALNRFFILYLLGFILSASVVIVALGILDRDSIRRSFSERFPVRLLGGFLVFVAAGLSTVWLGMWFAYAYFGVATPVEPDAFRLVAALDTAIMVPALAAGGVLLWRRSDWGYVLATMAAVQGALYLLVLTLNSALFIAWNLAEPPGELPMWGPLVVLTSATAITLLLSAKSANLAVGER